MSDSSTLLLRADASSRIGTGHVMRCLALAQAWQDAGGRAHFASAHDLGSLGARLAADGFDCTRIDAEAGSQGDALATAQLAHDLRAGWVVVDGYHFDARYQQALKAAGPRVLLLDDYGGAGHYHAGLVLNQNLGADAAWYARREPDTRLLLGTRYALLRREFRPWRCWKRTVPEAARKVLVTLGGADPDNRTLLVVEALERIAALGLEAIVVVGASYGHLATLRDHRGRIDIRRNVTDMPALMAWADVAVAAGGTTSWERALLGLPSLVLVLADNQTAVAAACEQAGLAVNLGRAEHLPSGRLAEELTALLENRERRLAMAQKGRECVDGNGATRVAGELGREPASGLLRPASAEDCRFLWELANEPAVRAVSFTGEPIPWESHCRWFAARLADPRCVLLIVTDVRGAPLGQVRFDRDPEQKQAVISVSLAPASRGRGLGVSVIREASRDLLATGQADSVLALVKIDNDASRRAFLKAGFVEDGTTEVRGSPALRLVMRRAG